MRPFKRLAAAAGFILCLASPAPADEDAAMTAELEGALAEVQATTSVTALGAAIITREDGLVAWAAVGERRRGSGEAVTRDDLWHIGSDTKAITAMLWAKRVEEGTLEWGASPLYELPDVARVADPAWLDIPIEAFFAHRAGLGQTGMGFLMTGRSDPRSDRDQRIALLQEKMSSPPDGQGEFSYSNLNYMLAGAAIEANGPSWQEQMSAFLIDEAGVSPGEFAFGPPQGDQPEGHRPPAFGFGGPRPVGQGTGADNPSALGPAGTLSMTLPGWAKVVHLMLTDGGGVLSPESIEKLTTPWPEGGESTYAMGWGVVSWDGSQIAWTHAGSNTYWLAQAVILPESGIAVLVVTNQADGKANDAVRAMTTRAIALAAGE